MPLPAGGGPTRWPASSSSTTGSEKPATHGRRTDAVASDREAPTICRGLPFCITRSTSAGREDQVLPQSRSDGAVMDVAPKGAWTAALQWTGDGVVGFFVVGFGVLVW